MNDLTKTCKKCSTDKPLESFWKNTRYKDGKEPECIECRKAYFATRQESIRKSQQKWREAHPDYQTSYSQTEKSKEYHRQYYREHAQDYKDRKAQWRADHPEEERATRQAYVDANRESINEYHRKWKAKKSETDPQYKLKINLSRRIRYELHALGKGRKTNRTVEYIGCTIEDLKTHLERQFTPEITWESYGTVWHIDHRIPCAAWDLVDDFESKCCWNYRNLQPMLSSDNQRKKDKYDMSEKNAYMESMRVVV